MIYAHQKVMKVSKMFSRQKWFLRFHVGSHFETSAFTAPSGIIVHYRAKICNQLIFKESSDHGNEIGVCIKYDINGYVGLSHF